MAKSLNGQNFIQGRPKKTTIGNGQTITAQKGPKEVPWPGKTLILFPMFKLLIASGVAVSAAALASPAAKAEGLYLNPEFNAGWSGSDFTGSILEGHVGWEKDGFYIQGGLLMAPA